MRTEALALAVSTHGCKGPNLWEPYFVSVWINTAVSAHRSLHLPAVVDDFGNIVIVRGPL